MDYKQAFDILKNKKSNVQFLNSYISEWESWYRGKVNNFHKYYVYNGEKKVYRTKASLKMAKQVCEDWASLLMNEKVKFVVASQKNMDKLLDDLDFYTVANETVEKAFALSMCAMTIDVEGVETIENQDGIDILTSLKNAKLTLSSKSVREIFPLNIVNNRIVECAFVQKDTDYIYTTVHILNDDGEYDIVKQVESRKDSSKIKAYLFHTYSKYPWFCIISPRISNNLDVDSKLPISIFANSIDTLKAIDNKYDSYDIEFMQGKKRTYVSSDFRKVNKETGEIEESFDPDETVIYRLPQNASINGTSNPYILNVSDTLRTAEHSQAIQDELNFLSKQVGLGVDYYRFEKGRVMTATQVISEKSDTFRNMKKHEILIENQLLKFFKGIMNAANNYTDIKFERPDEIVIQFDDSVIEDKTTEKDNDRKDVESGIMSKLEFRMKWYGEDEETAKQNLVKAFGDTDLASRINSFSQALYSNAITYEEYVKNVYPDLSESEQQKMVDELKSQGSITSDALGGFDPNLKL